MCNSYNKIVVTSQTQANRIIKRTKQNPTKVFVLPNISNTDDYSKKKLNIKKKYNFNKDDFIVSYSSTLYFDYTITGIIKLLSYFVKISQENPFVKLIIIGGGDGLSLLINKINELNLSQNVICTGKIKHVNEVLANTDVLIIPWEQDSMTETILPTKLFEYMRAKKPIIAPNFGEFRKVLEHNEDSLLYESISDIPKFILLLHKDQKLRSKLAANAYKKCIKYYSNDKYIKDFQDFVSI